LTSPRRPELTVCPSMSTSSGVHRKRSFKTDLPRPSTIVVLCPPLEEKNSEGGPKSRGCESSEIGGSRGFPAELLLSGVSPEGVRIDAGPNR
jgi:hypothetical protein